MTPKELLTQLNRDEVRFILQELQHTEEGLADMTDWKDAQHLRLWMKQIYAKLNIQAKAVAKERTR